LDKNLSFVLNSQPRLNHHVSDLTMANLPSALSRQQSLQTRAAKMVIPHNSVAAVKDQTPKSLRESSSDSSVEDPNMRNFLPDHLRQLLPRQPQMRQTRQQAPQEDDEQPIPRVNQTPVNRRLNLLQAT
jgi:hypothetical protein